MSPPNVLFVMCDQLAPHFTGTCGHPLVSTPHLDALAERGARFDAAYCHSPLCAPDRATLMTGRSMAAIGAWDNAAEFASSTPTVAHAMALAGGGCDEVSETTGEYAAELTSHPIFMIRRGTYKYIHCAIDYTAHDIDSDPLERSNLATDPAHADRSAALAAEVAQRWDSDAIRDQVMASQRARHRVHRAMIAGKPISWDHLPAQDVANSYERNHQDVVEASLRSRLPVRDREA